MYAGSLGLAMCHCLISVRLPGFILNKGKFEASSGVVISGNQYLADIYVVLGFQDMVYWSDWGAEAIFRANKFNGNNVSSIAGDLYSPMDLQVHHPYRQPKAVNRCNSNIEQCSHLCLPAPFNGDGSAKYTCACPGGRELMNDGHNCEPEGDSCVFFGGSILGIIKPMSCGRYFCTCWVSHHIWHLSKQHNCSNTCQIYIKLFTCS